MTKTTTYKGYKVYVGVSCEITKDSCTITGYPGKLGYTWKKYTKTWKNYCPFCKKTGVLKFSGYGGTKTALEGELTCKECNADFDGVSGKDKAVKVRKTLTPASKTNSTSATKSKQSALDKKEKLNKAIVEYNENSKPKIKYDVTVKGNKKHKTCGYVYIKSKGDVLPSKPYFISGVDSDEEGFQKLTITDYVPTPAEEYSPPSEKSTNATTSNVKASGKAKDSTEQKLMNLGAELGTIAKIKNYIKRDGTYGMDYRLYWDHIKGGDPYKWHKASADYCLKHKKANCVDFSWLLYAMCKGAGIKINIWNGSAKFGSTTYGHFWNELNGKRIDISSTTGKNYVKSKKVI
jgi:hypothetical protein